MDLIYADHRHRQSSQDIEPGRHKVCSSAGRQMTLRRTSMPQRTGVGRSTVRSAQRTVQHHVDEFKKHFFQMEKHLILAAVAEARAQGRLPGKTSGGIEPRKRRGGGGGGTGSILGSIEGILGLL